MPKMKKESAEERFWRGERKIGKFNGVEKGSFAERSGKLRPARSNQYLVNVAERFQQRIANKLSRFSFEFSRAAVKIEEMQARKLELLTRRDVSLQELAKLSIEIHELKLQKANSEIEYLKILGSEALKGNVPWKEGIEERINFLGEQKRDAIYDLKLLGSILKTTSEKVLRQYAETRRIMKLDTEYQTLWETARGYRAKYRKLNWREKANALMERKLLELKLIDPKKLKENQMLRGIQMAQQAVNCENADIKVLDKYIYHLRFRNQIEFEPLIKTILNIKRQKQQSLELNKKYLKMYKKYWYRKKR